MDPKKAQRQMASHEDVVSLPVNFITERGWSALGSGPLLTYGAGNLSHQITPAPSGLGTVFNEPFSCLLYFPVIYCLTWRYLMECPF